MFRRESDGPRGRSCTIGINMLKRHLSSIFFSMEFLHNTLYHSFYRVQLPTQHRIGLVDHFVQTSAVFVCSATSPADNRIQKHTLDNRVVGHLRHVTADIVGPLTPEEEKASCMLNLCWWSTPIPGPEPPGLSP